MHWIILPHIENMSAVLDFRRVLRRIVAIDDEEK